MIERSAVIGAPEGLHARPATMFVQAVKESGKDIRIALGDGSPVPAKSILSVLSLGAKCGETVTLTSEDESAEAALDQLVTLLENPDQ